MTLPLGVLTDEDLEHARETVASYRMDDEKSYEDYRCNAINLFPRLLATIDQMAIDEAATMGEMRRGLLLLKDRAEAAEAEVARLRAESLKVAAAIVMERDTIRAATIEECAKVAEAEPEPGEMSAVEAQVAAGHSVTTLVNAGVIVTKRNIAANIRALAAVDSPGDEGAKLPDGTPLRNLGSFAKYADNTPAPTSECGTCLGSGWAPAPEAMEHGLPTPVVKPCPACAPKPEPRGEDEQANLLEASLVEYATDLDRVTAERDEAREKYEHVCESLRFTTDDLLKVVEQRDLAQGRVRVLEEAIKAQKRWATGTNEWHRAVSETERLVGSWDGDGQ